MQLLDHADVAAAVVAVHRKLGLDRLDGIPPIHTTEIRKRCFRDLQFTGQDSLIGGARAVLVRVEGKWIICYDRSLPDAERRFHIAHEMGHLIRHAIADTVVSRHPCGPPDAYGERWANAFATALLIPETMLDRIVGDGPIFPENPEDQVGWHDFVDQLAAGRGFNVPRDVMLQALRRMEATRHLDRAERVEAAFVQARIAVSASRRAGTPARVRKVGG